MIDPVVERQYSDCRELLALWKAFSEFYAMGVKGENLTSEKEGQFLQLKSRIAELHDSFLDALTHDQNIGQSMLDVISRSITLKHLSRLSTGDVKKMEIEWHESYLLLNDTIGTLEDKRAELAKISEAQFKSQKAAAAARQKVVGFFTSAGFKLACIVSAVLFVTIGVQAFDIFDWDTIGTQQWATVPYRWGKYTVRKVYNPDSEWVTMDNSPRKEPGQWPAGLKAPKEKSRDLQDLMKELPRQLPPVIAENLAKAKEYRKEVSEKDFKGSVDIHTLLLPQTSQAKAIVDNFDQYAETPEGKELARSWRIMRDTNVVTVLHSSSFEMLNDAWVLVYEQTKQF